MTLHNCQNLFYQVHTCKKGVKKALTLDHETQKDQINEEEEKEEEKECISICSKGRFVR